MITMGLFSIFKSKKNDVVNNDNYNNYPDDLKEWCISIDKYLPFWNESGKYLEEINKYYSLFINNNLDETYFKELINYCNKYIELQPILNESRLEENRINKTNYPLPNSNIAYKKMILAYEKLQDYKTAIALCEEAISKGYTNDDTKGGYKERIEKLKNKLK